MELIDLMEEYLLDMEIKGFSKLTIKVRRDTIGLFIRNIGVKNLEDVRTIHIKKFILQRQKEVKAVTINSNIKQLRGMFKYAVKEKSIKYTKDDNPFEDIELLKQEKRIIKTYTSEDIQKILDYYNGKTFLEVRNKTILMMFVGTGIRSSELRSIRLENVTDGSIAILGKGNKWRSVPISLELKKQLMRYERTRKAYMGDLTSDWYFVSVKRKQIEIGTLKHVVEKVNDLVSVKATIHNFRRFYAQEMLKTTDLYTVSRLLGHSDVSITQVYVQGTEDKEILRRGMNSPLSNFK